MLDPNVTRTRSDDGDVPEALLEALGRSAVYVALSQAFDAPTGKETGHRLATTEGSRALAWALRAGGAGELSPEADALAARPPDPAIHDRLFGHTVRSPAPPFETEYGASTLFQQPQRLADIGGFFSAFGLEVRPSVHQRVDHVSCECEFMAFLARKEAFAIQHRRDDMLGETRKAQHLFLQEHLGRFAPALGERLRREDSGGFYDSVGSLLRRFVETECRRVGVQAGVESLVLRKDEADGQPMMCGGGPDCVPEGCPE